MDDKMIMYMLLMLMPMLMTSSVSAQSCIDDPVKEEPRVINNIYTPTTGANNESMQLALAKLDTIEALQKYDTEILQTMRTDVHQQLHELGNSSSTTQVVETLLKFSASVLQIGSLNEKMDQLLGNASLGHYAASCKPASNTSSAGGNHDPSSSVINLLQNMSKRMQAIEDQMTKFADPQDEEKLCPLSSIQSSTLDRLCEKLGNATQLSNCNSRSVKSINNPYLVATQIRMGSNWMHHGAWMRDPLPISGLYEDTLWLIGTQYISNTLYEFRNEIAFNGKSYSKTYTLPYRCAFDQHVMYNGAFYCNRYDSPIISKYNITTGMMVNKTLPWAGRCGYKRTWQQGADFEIDENGMWVIYGNVSQHCHMLVSKVDPYTLEILFTLTIPGIVTNRVGNAFMKCGILYVLADFTSGHVEVSHMFNVTSREITALRRNTVQLPIMGHYLCMVNYNPRDKKIYTFEYYYPSHYGIARRYMVTEN